MKLVFLAAVFALGCSKNLGSEECQRMALKRGYRDCHAMSRHDRAAEFARALKISAYSCTPEANVCSAVLDGRPVRILCWPVGCNLEPSPLPW